jgi:RNA recognition motif-containing protein
MKKLFVSSLPYSVDDAQLEQIFASYGTVLSAKVIIDRDTGRSKGFGFVEIEEDDKAAQAIAELHESEYEGRNLIVNEARPKEDKPRGGGGGYGGGSRGNGGGGYGGGGNRY